MLKVTKTPTGVKKDTTYPCLGIFNDTGRIVLFINKNTGTLIAGKDDDKIYSIGRYTNSWSNDWVPYTGTITLTNELWKL